MKKRTVLVVFLCLLCLLVSCGQNGLPPPRPANIGDPLGTVVAETLTAVSSGTRAAQSTPGAAPGPSPQDFSNQEFVGENGDYSVYLVNRDGGTDAAPRGGLLLYDKSTNQAIRMSGSFTVIVGGGTIVYDDGNGKYVLLSIGTYTSRNAVVLSLAARRQAVNDFCMSSGPYGDHLFWDDHVIINNCDTFPNRPWGAGEAPSVAAIDLGTGLETTIARSDLTHQFQIKQIDGNDLQYIETYVENGEDWQSQDKQKTEEKSYDLSSLGGAK
ncbi:MAG TPA: hypothetical protein VLZ89_02955 [Anaerolineales bacterium]|nr:hypothetical protein [Anaerolineales bacterium]